MLTTGAQAALALAAAGAVSAAAWRAGALTKSGALSATAVGALVLWAGGLAWAVLLLVFFVSGSALTRWRRRRRELASGSRSGGRDAYQVLANGGVAALAAAMRLVTDAQGAASATTAGPAAGAWVWDALVAGSLAAMMADTWATEVGLLSGARPVLLVGWRPVEPGRSGAVSAPGTLAGLAGAAVLAGLSLAARGSTALAAGALAGGMTGLLADSLLGATLQGRWRCVRCGACVEVPRRHRRRCLGPVVQESGLAWLDNDAVNAVASLTGGVVAALAAGLLRPGA